jgi:hypothetical protein
MASIEEGPQQGPAFCDTLTREQYDLARVHERERLGLPAEAAAQPIMWWCHSAAAN